MTVMYSVNPQQFPAGGRPVTLVTTFRLREDASPNHFVRLWTEVANLMARRSGFISVRLYPAGGGFDPREYIQVAHWTHADLLANAQSAPEIRTAQAEARKPVALLHRVLCDTPIQEVIAPALASSAIKYVLVPV